MPFDGTNVKPKRTRMTRRERLARLCILLDGMRDVEQGSFGTCLWSRAIADPVLLQAGLKPTLRLSGNKFFGEDAAGAFGCAGVEHKRRLLLSLIAAVDRRRLKAAA